MEIATILPIPYLTLEAASPYHMCLAHLMSDKHYCEFFEKQAKRGAFVLMDNGVVETHEPMPIHELTTLYLETGVTEFILPDKPLDRDETMRLSEDALLYVQETLGSSISPVMAVPQGRTASDWVACAREMATWPVQAIGISKFTCEYFLDRVKALDLVMDAFNDGGKMVHLLGCPGDPREIYNAELAFPGLIRGVDSGTATIYTQADAIMMDHWGDKPTIEIDFYRSGDLTQLAMNIACWKARCVGML